MIQNSSIEFFFVISKIYLFCRKKAFADGLLGFDILLNTYNTL